jgi:predicted DNA-binding helix-hairpin-helix protein
LLLLFILIWAVSAPRNFPARGICSIVHDDCYEGHRFEGIFLSSGVTGGRVRSQDKLIDAADIMRHKLNFHGYIHLKVMPGSEKDQVERAMLLADRVSVNLEAPNDLRLSKLAPPKQFVEVLLQPLKWMDEIRRKKPGYTAWKGHWPSSVSQFVVGGAGESDLELLVTSENLYQQLNLKRVYFSRFNPIPNTPLENQPATPIIREHRLYQASFLVRDYFFRVEELPFDKDDMLPVQTNPKLAWAQKNLTGRPIEINRAERQELFQVPGFGPRGAEIILRIRRQEKIRDLSMLKNIGIQTEKVAPYLLLDGRRAPFQPALI